MGVGWHFFTGHEGTDPVWDNPELVHDGDLATKSTTYFYGLGPTEWLYVTCDPPAEANQVNFLLGTAPISWVFPLYRMQVEIDGVWSTPVTGVYGKGPDWHSYYWGPFPSLLTRARIQMWTYNENAYNYVWAFEARFYTPGSWPPPKRGGTSLALDVQERPCIAYYHPNSTDLKYAYWDGASWQKVSVDSIGAVGRWPSLAGAVPASGAYRVNDRDSGVDAVDIALAVTWCTCSLDFSGNTNSAYVALL